MIYILPILICSGVFFVNFIYGSRKVSAAYKHLVTAFALLTAYLISALRWDVGSDWEAYYIFYNYEYHFEYYFEYGYIVVAALAAALSFNYIGFQSLISLAIFIPIIPIYKIIDFDIEAFLVLFIAIFFAAYLGGQRFSISISLLFIAYVFLLRGEGKYFLLICLCASLFHVSAGLITIPVYLMSTRITSRVLIKYLFPMAMIGGFLFTPENIEFLSIVTEIDKGLSYQGRTAVGEEYDSIAKDALIYIERIFSIAVLYAFFFKVNGEVKLKNNLQIDYLFRMACWSGIVFFFFHDASRMMAGRGSLIFRIPEILLWAILFEKINDTKSFVVRVGSKFLLYVYALAKTMITFSPDYYHPYTWYFGK